jgi:hypothetical protein
VRATQNAISHPSSAAGVVEVRKEEEAQAALPSPIERVYYLNEYQQEIEPAANPQLLRSLSEAEIVVYAIGSLYTRYCHPALLLPSRRPPRWALLLLLLTCSCSIAAQLMARGVGETVAGLKCAKVLLLNSEPDRESGDLQADGFVLALTDALNRRGSATPLQHPPAAYFTHVVAVEGSRVLAREEALARLGVRLLHCPSAGDPSRPAALGAAAFSAPHLLRVLLALTWPHLSPADLSRVPCHPDAFSASCLPSPSPSPHLVHLPLRSPSSSSSSSSSVPPTAHAVATPSSEYHAPSVEIFCSPSPSTSL